MTLPYIILLAILYLAIGAIVAGLMGFDEDPYCTIVVWPIFIFVLIVYYIFLPFVKLCGFVSDKHRRYKFKKKSRRGK